MTHPKDNQEPPTTPVSPEDQAKADRAIKILYGVMILFIVAPFVALWLFR